MPYLEVLNGPEVGQKTSVVHETFFIGRDPNNHLALSDRTVSRKHAVLNQIEGQYVLSDLKSLKGILVNGEKKGEAVLEDGDEIVLGAVRLRFYGAELSVSKVLPLRKRRGRRFLRIFFILVFIGGIAGIFFLRPEILRDFFTKKTSAEMIKTHYEKGLELFNVLKDPSGARQEWQKVLKLDPDKETPYAKKAAELLKKLRE